MNLNWGSIPFDSITDTQDVTTGIDEHLDWQLFIRHTYLMDTLLQSYIKSAETAGSSQALASDEGKEGKEITFFSSRRARRHIGISY